MKRKIIGGFAVLAIAALAAFNMGLGSKTNVMSDIILANIEALAQEDQEKPYCECTKACPDGETYAYCRGYRECRCNSGGYYVECDGIKSYC